MNTETEYVISVFQVEPLRVTVTVVDHSNRCDVVDYVTVAQIEQVVSAVKSSIAVNNSTNRTFWVPVDFLQLGLIFRIFLLDHGLVEIRLPANWKVMVQSIYLWEKHDLDAH